MLHETDVPHVIPAATFEAPCMRIPSEYEDRSEQKPHSMVFANKPSLTPLPTQFFVLFCFEARTVQSSGKPCRSACCRRAASLQETTDGEWLWLTMWAEGLAGWPLREADSGLLDAPSLAALI